jgi:hypothetical protein
MGTAVETGERFLAAVLDRDTAALGRCLSARVRLRALEPGGAVVRTGAEAVAARWDEWLGGWDRLTVLHRRSWPVAGSRVCLSYHVVVDTAADRREIAHQIVVDVVGDRIVAVDLLCTGFLTGPDPFGDLGP